MVPNATDLAEEFSQYAARQGWRVSVSHERQIAPHVPRPLPLGKCAVYVFSLSEAAGAACPAGPNRVVKVGKAGPNSNPRFQHQHYSPSSARSSLAGSILRGASLWPFLGIEHLTEASVGAWIRENIDRDHFYLEAGEYRRLSVLERFIRGSLGGAVFEGG
jgi:hypothetical protein